MAPLVAALAPIFTSTGLGAAAVGVSAASSLYGISQAKKQRKETSSIDTKIKQDEEAAKEKERKRILTLQEHKTKQRRAMQPVEEERVESALGRKTLLGQ